MSLSKKEQDKIFEWFDQHKEQAPASGCPICHTRDWAVLNTLYALQEVERKDGRLEKKSADAPGGEKAKILVALSCKNCGNTMFFNPDKMGIDL